MALVNRKNQVMQRCEAGSDQEPVNAKHVPEIEPDEDAARRAARQNGEGRKRADLFKTLHLEYIGEDCDEKGPGG